MFLDAGGYPQAQFAGGSQILQPRHFYLFEYFTASIEAMTPGKIFTKQDLKGAYVLKRDRCHVFIGGRLPAGAFYRREPNHTLNGKLNWIPD